MFTFDPLIYFLSNNPLCTWVMFQQRLRRSSTYCLLQDIVFTQLTSEFCFYKYLYILEYVTTSLSFFFN